jgi:hypothetical protein
MPLSVAAHHQSNPNLAHSSSILTGSPIQPLLLVDAPAGDSVDATTRIGIASSQFGSSGTAKERSGSRALSVGAKAEVSEHGDPACLPPIDGCRKSTRLVGPN